MCARRLESREDRIINEFIIEVVAQVLDKIRDNWLRWSRHEKR